MRCLCDALCALCRMPDERGLTPLHVAAQHDQLHVLQWLSVNVTDLDTLTPTGYTPLHLAAMHGHTECIKVLSAMGAQLDYRNGEGETPLHLAAVRCASYIHTSPPSGARHTLTPRRRQVRVIRSHLVAVRCASYAHTLPP